MLRVALTGGVGSGKSTVSGILRDLGAQVSNSDEVARRLMQPGKPVFQQIVAHFGPKIVGSDGSLDRKALARIVFDAGRVDEINRIVHPPVIEQQNQWLQAFETFAPDTIAIVETALLFESAYRTEPAYRTDSPAGQPWRSAFDRIVLVTAPESLRLERYIARVLAFDPAVDRADVAADFHRRAALQWSDERKAAMSDLVIPNAGTMDDLRAAVADVFSLLRTEAAASAKIGQELPPT